jgi:hypothetical protein
VVGNGPRHAFLILLCYKIPQFSAAGQGDCILNGDGGSWLGCRTVAVVDNMDHQVESNYSGWPDRLYLVDRNGRIAWTGDPGPGGFRPEDLQAAIQKELALRNNP